MCSQTNFRPVDSEALDASRIPRLDGDPRIAEIESKELREKDVWRKWSSSQNLNHRDGLHTKDWSDLFPIRMAAETIRANELESCLGRAEDNHADFGRDAQAYWSAHGAQAAIHINVGHGA